MNPTWYSTPQHLRKRKAVTVTLSDAARKRLAQLAKRNQCSKSEMVERLITKEFE
jgi:predicted transcriptional regulator